MANAQYSVSGYCKLYCVRCNYLLIYFHKRKRILKEFLNIAKCKQRIKYDLFATQSLLACWIIILTFYIEFIWTNHWILNIDGVFNCELGTPHCVSYDKLPLTDSVQQVPIGLMWLWPTFITYVSQQRAFCTEQRCILKFYQSTLLIAMP